MHANIWIKDLAEGNEESKVRIQNALDKAYPMALSLFEPGEFDKELKEAGIFSGEDECRKIWEKEVGAVIIDAGLEIPQVSDSKEFFGGRNGKHTEHLQPLLDEMTEVFQIDPTADW